MLLGKSSSTIRSITWTRPLQRQLNHSYLQTMLIYQNSRPVTIEGGLLKLLWTLQKESRFWIFKESPLDSSTPPHLAQVPFHHTHTSSSQPWRRRKRRKPSYFIKNNVIFEIKKSLISHQITKVTNNNQQKLIKHTKINLVIW